MEIINERVNGGIIKKEGLFIDMHFHTNYSDGSTRLKTIEKICKKRDIGVAITDHNEIKGCLNAVNYDFVMIPGIEVRSNENVDLLFYFYNIDGLEEFYRNVINVNKTSRIKYKGLKLNAVEIVELSKKYNSISCIPHPFSLLHFAGIKKENGNYSNRGLYRDGLGILRMVDAIEAMNGHLLKRGNKKALELAYNMNKACTAGSDGHIRFDLGKILNHVECDDAEGFLNGVIAKKNNIYIYNGTLRRMVVSRTWAFRKHVTHPVYYLNRLIRYGKSKIKND